MRGGVDIARAYDLPDSVELQKVESKTLDLDLDDTFTTFEKSPCEVKEVVELLTPKAINTQSNELHPFIVASMNGQISRVEAMLKKENVDVNMFTEAHKLTALMGACHQGHTEVARLLIEHGANGNMVANEGSSALSLACQEGHYETAKLLLENGANPNVQGETKCTPLMLASFCGHYRVVNLLLRYNAKVNLVDSLQRSALMIACNNGHYDVAEILLKHDAQIDAQDVVGCTALIFASNHGHFEVAKLLLEHGAKPDIKNSNKESALSIACQQSHYSIAKLLVEKLKGTENWMYIINHALLVASQGGHFPLVKLLIDNGAQVSIKNALGASSLNLASENGHYEVVELLLEKGAEVDAQDLNGRTSLMGASYFGHLKIVRLLVDKGAQVNIQDKRRGSFPLMEASSQGRHSIVKHLLAHGAQVDMQSKDGLTALLVACYYGQFRVVSLLLDKSADLNLQEKHHGASPLLVSSWKGHTDIAQLLLDNGAKVDQLLTHAYGYGASSLLLASQNGHYEIVELLLDKNAQIDLLTNNPDHPRSALMLASQLGHYDICKLLLERGARIELQERSALMLAANSKISQLLLENGAKVDYQDDRGLFPLAEACKRGDYDTVMLLLKRGAGVDLQAQQMTSLMMSCHMDFYDITKLLLDHGANPNLPDSGGLSSLHYASFFGRTRVVKLLIARGAQSDLRAQGHAALILAGNVEIVNLLMGITEFSLSRQDLFEALQIAVHANNAPMVKYFFNKCLEIIGNIFCLNSKLKSIIIIVSIILNHHHYFMAADPGFPEIAFFKDKVEKRITSEGAEIECAGLSVSIPKGTIAEEDSTDLLIRPCFSGPFELPPGYVSASPAFLIQPDRHVTMKKDVTVRIHHYADLCTEEDCEDMVFLSASPTPHKSSGVYWFKKIERVRCLFRAGDPVGEIKVRHFCLIKVVRWIGRKRQSRVNRGQLNLKFMHYAMNLLDTYRSMHCEVVSQLNS